MDGSFGHFDIVVFAVIAAFLALRLRSVLGKKVGFHISPAPTPAPQPAAGPVIEGRAESVSSPTFDIPSPATRVGALLGQIGQKDPAFTPQQFLTGVEGAFRQILGAYATGNRVVLKERLAPEAYAAFDAAIAARETAGETQKTDIRGIDSIAIQDVRLTAGSAGTAAVIDVRIVSDQISLVTDRDDRPVTGTDAVTEFSDLWTFEKLLGMGGATWRLSAARSA